MSMALQYCVDMASTVRNENESRNIHCTSSFLGHTKIVFGVSVSDKARWTEEQERHFPRTKETINVMWNLTYKHYESHCNTRGDLV